MEVAQDTIEAFASLFKARSDAWGSVEGLCNKEPVTLDHYERHLRGEASLGLYPLLDDGTCHWFAIDLDEKDFDKAKSIRQELANNYIPTYIAESKRKGYHIYGFAFEPFAAKDIRHIISHILNKLKIKAEIFPKQDTLDEITPLGNYINLPCCGYGRSFITTDLKTVPVESVIERIKTIEPKAIEQMLLTLPVEKPLAPRKVRGRQKKHPPCIETIAKGVSAGQRDEAAFALARHFLDQQYLPEEVLGLLKTWDVKNTPPVNDDRLLETKIRSAEKGYGFGCSSITDNPMLATFCVGEDECEWIKQAQENKYTIITPTGALKLNLSKLVKDLLTEFHFATYTDTHEVLVYRDEFWKTNGEEFIERECQRRVQDTELLTRYKINEILGHIQRTTYCKRSIFNRNKWVIDLENGILDVRNSELQLHTPELLSTVRIPVTYDPKADCPQIKQFLKEILQPADIPVIEEQFGYCLIPDYSIQKAFLFVGDGSNGKSTLLNLLKEFVGRNNCSNVPWHALELDKFAMATLEGKLINMFADIPSQSLNRTGSFKMLTGGDAIGADKKFKDRFSFENFARLIFSANKPPNISGEDSFAFWRRWVIINFPNEFLNSTDDKGKLNKLVTPEELSGLLNLALKGLERLLKQGSYSYNKSVEDTTAFYLRASDPVYAFLEDICESAPDQCVAKEALHLTYEDYCRKNNLPIKKPNSFARALQNQTYIMVKSARPRIGGELTRVWQGIKYREKEEEIDMKV